MKHIIMRSFNDLAIEQFMRAEFDRMPLDQTGRLLDLGCGERQYYELYRKHFEFNLAGDYDVRTAHLAVRLDAQLLPFADSVFDVIVLSEVIEHVPNMAAALNEIGRVLKPGGILLMTWPFNYMMHELPHDYTRCTEFGMAHHLATAKLEIEVMRRRGNALILALVLAEFFLGGILELLTRIPVIGNLCHWIRQVVLFLICGLPYRAYLLFDKSETGVSQSAPGGGLRGWRGHMSLWTLGYCVRARKHH
jgi:SAM-dependent methyltransferase